MVLTIFKNYFATTNIPRTAICEQRLMFCIVGQVISSLPLSCQKITKLNEIDNMEMTTLSSLALS